MRSARRALSMARDAGSRTTRVPNFLLEALARRQGLAYLLLSPSGTRRIGLPMLQNSTIAVYA